MMGHLEKLLSPTMEAMGYEAVRVILSGSQNPTLQVMAERQDGAPMTVTDCEALSHALSAVLDIEDPIKGAYRLEVSSPGLDRPLTKPKDFARFAGALARIETDRPLDGRRRFKGTLLGIDDERVVSLAPEAGGGGKTDGPDAAEVLRIPFSTILKARLLVTDALIAEALKAQTAPEDQASAEAQAVPAPTETAARSDTPSQGT